jgi:hypothetical protein
MSKFTTVIFHSNLVLEDLAFDNGTTLKSKITTGAVRRVGELISYFSANAGTSRPINDVKAELVAISQRSHPNQALKSHVAWVGRFLAGMDKAGKIARI